MTHPKVDVDFDEGNFFNTPTPPTIQDNGGTAIPAQTTGPSGQTAPSTAAPQEPIFQGGLPPARSTTTTPSLRNLPNTTGISDELTKAVQGPSRPNYSPDLLGVPTTVEEARKASVWLRASKVGSQLYRDPFSREVLDFSGALPVDVDGNPIIPLEQLQAFEFREQVDFAVDTLEEENREFMQLQGQSEIETKQSAIAADLKFQADARLAEIEAGLDQGTPEQRAARRDEVTAGLQSALEFLEEEGREDNQTLETILGLNIRLSERRTEFDTDIRDIKGEMARVDAFLDRALKALDLQEASRAARAQEDLTARLRTTEENQLKLNILSTFADSPELIYFMGKQGTLGLFEGLLGEDDTSLEDMFARLDERPTTNIQEFRRLTGEEQGRERFRFSAQTGVSNVDQALQQQAPTGLGSGFQRIRVGR